MKIYISGKITGDPDYKEKFARVEEKIAKNGDIALNPAKAPEGLTNSEYMRLAFAMIDASDAVYFLRDYSTSRGARIEHRYAHYVGKKIIMEGKDGRL